MLKKQIHRTASSSNSKKYNNLKKSTKRKINKSMLIMSLIDVLFTILLVGFVISLHMVPTKFIVLIAFVLLVLDLLVLFLLKKKKAIFKIVGYVISFFLVIMSSIGIYYIAKTNSFLNKAFNNASNSYTSTYYIVSRVNSPISSLDDLADSTIGYYTVIPNIDKAIDEISSKVTITTKKYDDILSNFNDVKRNIIDATIVEQSIYEALIDTEIGVIKETDYKIVHTFDVSIEEEVEEIIDDGNSFSVYIGGVDFTEKNTDFNMVVTVNMKTHKILLTSIPRDYYVNVSSYGMHELLGYVGYSGINTSRKTIEELFGVNIDYYVKISTNSIVGLVNTLGGVQFCNSGPAFTTTHAVVQGTYDDSRGQKLTVPNGCRTYNGTQIVRERLAFSDGDRQRQKNCQQVMINIFKQMASFGTITNYSNVLDAVSNLYTTNLSRDMITDIANETINGASWTFEQQSVTGYDSNGYVHMGTVKDYVMSPDEDSVNEAIANIKKIKAGK